MLSITILIKGMSHNLELLSYQKICGLLGFIRNSDPRADGPEGWLIP